MSWHGSATCHGERWRSISAALSDVDRYGFCMSSDLAKLGGDSSLHHMVQASPRLLRIAGSIISVGSLSPIAIDTARAPRIL